MILLGNYAFFPLRLSQLRLLWPLLKLSARIKFVCGIYEFVKELYQWVPESVMLGKECGL